jgi:hypothetical protein
MLESVGRLTESAMQRALRPQTRQITNKGKDNRRQRTPQKGKCKTATNACGVDKIPFKQVTRRLRHAKGLSPANRPGH